MEKIKSEKTVLCENEDSSPFEALLEKIGIGKFHLKLLLICSWSFVCDAIEIICVTLAWPSIACELRLVDSKNGLLNAVIFLGMLIGGTIWGNAGDYCGRKPILILSALLNAIFAIISSLSQNYDFFITFRFFSALGIGGNLPIVISYCSEFLSRNNRGSLLSCINFAWTIGASLITAIAWIIIPMHLDWNFLNLTFNSWRFFIALSVLPSFSSLLLFLLLPESPRYLFKKRLYDKSEAVLLSMYASNNPEKNDYDFKEEVDNLCIEENERKGVDEYLKPRDKAISLIILELKNYLIQFGNSIRQLFIGSVRKNTIIMSLVFSAISFSYYGLIMWLPVFFQRVETNGGYLCSTVNKLKNTTINLNVNQSCVMSSTIYKDSLLVSISGFPGCILVMLLVDKLGRKTFFTTGSILGGLSVFVMWFLNNATHNLIFSCFFGGLTIISWNIINIVMPELFPTHLRSTAAGFVFSTGRAMAILGSLIIGHLMGKYCFTALLIISLMLILAGLLYAIGLPETKNKELA